MRSFRDHGPNFAFERLGLYGLRAEFRARHDLEARVELHHQPGELTQAELADAANLSRNKAGTILRALAARGFIETDYRGVVVRDRERLQGFVDQYRE